MKLKSLLWIAFLMGLGSSLFVPTPFGRVAMFDFGSFLLAPFLFLYNRHKFTQVEKKILLASFTWFLGACFSNWWRAEEFEIALKGVAIVFNVTCMLVVLLVVLKKSLRVFLWFCVGSAVGWVISLYVFQNGAILSFAETAGYSGMGGVQEFLVEKQVYPIYATAIFIALIFPLRSLGLIPWIVVCAVSFTSAFVLLFFGGSRYGFGVMLSTSLIVTGYAYFRSLVQFVLRNFILCLVVSTLLVSMSYQSYKYLAQSGTLGEAEYQKYLSEMVDSESGALGSRDDLIRAWPFLQSHPFVGSGSSGFDRWGVIKDDSIIPGHSAVVMAWTRDGIAGLIFWLYALYLITNFIRKRMILFGDWFPFLAFQIISVTWAILFSPFGGYRGLICMVVALSSVSCSPKAIEQIKFNSTKKKLSKY